MNKKLFKALQDKCKDFGLTDKAIEELAESAPEGLSDESSDVLQFLHLLDVGK